MGIAGGDAPFGVDMYRKIFELVLRLKGNYVWPASAYSLCARFKANSSR